MKVYPVGITYITMQNLEVVASKLAKLWLFSLRLDTHLLKFYTQAVWLGRLDTSVIYQLSCPVSPDLLKCYTQAVYLGHLDQLINRYLV